MGIKKIHRPPQNWWERVYILEIMRGLAITMRHALRSLLKPDTMPTFQYPEQKRPVADRWRGKHLLRRRADGTPVCVACFCCESICPAKAITITAEESDDPQIEKRPKEFRINMLRCIFCGMCVEACPKDAITMTKEYELAKNTREGLYFGLNELLESQKKE
jgi:NADH-quinone oxidoreductase subunit I